MKELFWSENKPHSKIGFNNLSEIFQDILAGTGYMADKNKKYWFQVSKVWKYFTKGLKIFHKSFLRGVSDLFGISFSSKSFPKHFKELLVFHRLRYMKGEALKCPSACIISSVGKWKCGNFDIFQKSVFLPNQINLPECYDGMYPGRWKNTTV